MLKVLIVLVAGAALAGCNAHAQVRTGTIVQGPGGYHHGHGHHHSHGPGAGYNYGAVQRRRVEPNIPPGGHRYRCDAETGRPANPGSAWCNIPAR